MRPSEPDAARRDVLYVIVAVAVLFLLGLAFDVYDRFEPLFTRQESGDEVIGLLILALTGLTLIAVRRAHSVREQTERREIADGRLRALIAESPVVSYSWDPVHHRYLYISPQVDGLFGISGEEHAADWSSLIHPDDRERILAISEQADGDATTYLAEYRIVRPDGVVRWIHDESHYHHPGPDGRPTLAQGVMFDITERTEAEARATDAEQRYRTLVERVPAIAYSWDTAFAPGTAPADYISPQIERLVGVSPQDWLDDPTAWAARVHPSDLDRVTDAWAAATAAVEPFSQEYRLRRSSGDWLWVQDDANPVGPGVHGAPVYQGVIIDITERRAAEDEVREAERRWRLMLEHLPIVAYQISFDGAGEARDRWVAGGIYRLAGVTALEWLADPDAWDKLIHEEDRDAVLGAWEELKTRGTPFDGQYRLRRRDGEVVWVHDRAAMTEREGARVIEGAFADITARQDAEAALGAAEARFRTLVEQLPVAVYTDAVDDVSTALYISPQYEQLTGFTAEQRLQDPDLWANMLHPDDRPGVLAESVRTNETGEPFDIEYRIVTADGRVVWLHDHAVQVRDDSGQSRWHGVLQDVTDSRRSAETIARRDAILEATSFAAERFLRSRSWQDYLPDVLERLGRAGEASRCAVFRNHDVAHGDLGVSIVDAWLADGYPHEDGDIERNFAWESGGFGRWVQEMSAGRPIHGAMATFPEQERATLEAGDLPIRSLVAIPIFVDDAWWGYISFDQVDEDRHWSDADTEALSLTASTIGAAIERERGVSRLEEAQALYRTLIEQLPAVTYIEELVTGDEIYSSPQTETLLGYAGDEWGPHARWVEALHPDDRERVLAEDDAAGETGATFRSVYRMVTKAGETVWVRDEATLVHDADGSPRFWQGVRFDITAEKEAERQLRQAEERYRQLVEEMPAITYLDACEPGSDLWPTRYISPQVQTIIGYSPEEWLENPRRWHELVHPEDRQVALAADAAHYDRGEPLDIEIRIFDRSGGLHWIRDQAVIIRDDDGAPRFSQGIIQDITERKQAELAMLDAERRYRTLIESIPAVTYVDSLEEPFATVYVSPQVTDTFGFDPDAWRQEGLWIGRVHPDEATHAREAMRAHGQDHEPFDLEYRFQHADGRWLWVRDQAFIVRDERGNALFSQGVMYDITTTKESEERLRDAEQRYRAIVEHVPAAIYLDEPDGGMQSIYMSPQIAAIAGVTPEAWVQDPTLWLTLIDQEDRAAIEASYSRAAVERQPWRAEYRIHTPDGRTVWIHDETTFLFGPDGEPLFLQGVLFDITERKLAEQALRESERRERDAAERLRALDEMKNTFLAAVSHELRSPLTSILGLSLTLERAPDIEGHDRDDLLTRLSANAKKLDRLLKDLLDIDRLNRGIVEPQYRVTDVAALARRIVENLDALATRTVVVHTDPVVIPIDPPKVERIVENLLTNAVRHTTPDRTIWLTVAPHNGGVRISVEDNGPGVPLDIRGAIFEPFRQGPTQSPHSPGTGIGLSLVARFAELHGGTAWVEERDGGGAAFHVVIPGRIPEHVEPATERARADAG